MRRFSNESSTCYILNDPTKVQGIDAEIFHSLDAVIFEEDLEGPHKSPAISYSPQKILD